MQYDIEADWILLTTCNFRCKYCFVPTAALGAKIKQHGTPRQWRDGFRASGKTWLLHITGGEPSIYPGFVELCEELSQEHYLSLNSNLTQRSINDFAQRIDPRRVSFINAAVHYTERLHKRMLTPFVDRVRRLQDRGFNVLVSLVMTPAMVDVLPELAEYFASQGISLIPKVLRSTYEGARYPRDYTAGQRDAIARFVAAACHAYAPVLANMAERPTIDMFQDERLLGGRVSYQGRLCGSGYNFVRIDPEGTLVRCGSGQKLGNVLRKRFRLLKRPKVCDTTYCPYFCEKYTSTRLVQISSHAPTANPVAAWLRGALGRWNARDAA